MNEVILALFSLIIGASITHVVGILWARKSTDLDLLNDQIAQFDRVQSAAVAYWYHCPQPNRDMEKQLATCLLGEVTASSYFEPEAERIMKQSYSDFSKLDGELFDLATGGEFQTILKTPDYNRVIEIMLKCHEIRAFLRKSRRSLFGAR